MTKQTEAMKLALEALQEVYLGSRSAKHDEAITALREALAEQPAQQEPVALKPQDVIVETYAIQQGGFMLKPASGVRLIHKPTGTVVQCDSERSQHRNREIAWRDLEKHLTKITPAAAPVPDAITGDDESPEYRTGWNECRETMLNKLATPPAAPVQESVECQYGNGGYACCEGGPCKADEQNNAAPDWEAKYIEAVRLHNITLDELRDALAAPVQEPVWCGHCNGSGRMVRDPDIGTDQECFVCDGAGVPAAPVQNSDHEFKNFHRVLCERFGYTHDEVDWKRDQVSLIEWIAKQATPPASPVQEPVAAECKFDREKEWGRCTIEHHKLVQSEPHRWPGYQTRLLYTTSPAANPAQGKEPVKLWCETCEGCGKVHQEYQIGCFVGGEHDCPDCDGKGYYTTPPAAQRQWTGLTEQEIDAAFDYGNGTRLAAGRAIEAKLRKKNGGRP